MINKLKKTLDSLVEEKKLKVMNSEEARKKLPSKVIALIGNKYNPESMKIVVGKVNIGGVSGQLYTPSSQKFRSGQALFSSDEVYVYSGRVPEEKSVEGKTVRNIIKYFQDAEE